MVAPLKVYQLVSYCGLKLVTYQSWKYILGKKLSSLVYQNLNHF
jgi:hypothetical protein